MDLTDSPERRAFRGRARGDHKRSGDYLPLAAQGLILGAGN